MSFRSKRNSLVDHVRGFIYRPTPHGTSQNQIELGSLDATDVLGFSLHKEAVGGSRKCLKKVLLSAICVDYPNNYGQTPLFCACSRDNEANALLLLQYGANPNEKSQAGVTPTHAACYIGNIRLLSKLIEAGGDLRLHDNDGNSMRDWALQNPEPKRRAKMLEFLDKTHIWAMVYSGDATSADQFSRYAGRVYKQPSLMEIVKMRTGSDSTFENLKRVQSMGFGKVYLGGDFSGGIVSVVPLVSEALLAHTENICFDAGFGTIIEQMEWMHMSVSVKKAKPNSELEGGIDNIISEAEYLGKLRHPSIVLLMGICQSTSLENMWLIFEYFEQTTLHHSLHNWKNTLQFSRKRSIISQVCNAMEFIHNQSLIHCGLSSLAIYLVSPHTSKVGNFEFMVESMKADLGKPSRVCGVPHGRFLYNWMSPELMREEAPRFSSDVYSFCCIVWEMFAGEVPWVGLEPQDIFEKVVEENIQLNLDYASLPTKLKAIVGYGLELREEDRLHKFSLINNWLKSEKTPDFQRSHSPLQWVNRSSNHVELTSSSSHSSSLPSCSSRADGGSSTGQECQTQDRTSFHKRFSLDFESPVNTAFPFSPAVDLSHLSTEQNCCNVSVCDSGRDLPPTKPPRAFTSSRLSGLSNRTNGLEQFEKSPQKSTNSHLKKGTESSPVSPSRIKPASHSYQCGSIYDTVGETATAASAATESLPSPPRTNPFQHHHMIHGTLEEKQEKCTVKAMADRYQHIQSQHKLRQAILKGSMAPRGSCQNLQISSESIKTESFETDDLEPIVGSQNRQVSDLGSLNGTPLLKSSSTPKAATPLVPKPAAKLQGSPEKELNTITEGTIEGKSNARSMLEANLPVEEAEETAQKEHDEESSIKKRRAFIEDIKQKYSSLKIKPLTDVDTGFMLGSSYHSPVLQFRSLCRDNQADELSPPVPVTVSQNTEGTPSKIDKFEHPVKPFGREQEKLAPLKSPKTDITSHLRKTPLESASCEDDSFWVVTPMIEKKNENLVKELSEDKDNKVCNILHADYPEKGYRVIMKADWADSSTCTMYYLNSERGKSRSTPSSSDHKELMQSQSTEVINNEIPPSKCQGSKEDVLDLLEESRFYLDREPKAKVNKFAVGDENEDQELDGTFTMDDHQDEDNDKLDRTFTLDVDFTEPPYLPNTSFGTDKVIQWVDNQLDKIKDNIGLKTDMGDRSSSSLCGIEDVPAERRKREASVSLSGSTCNKAEANDHTKREEPTLCPEKESEVYVSTVSTEISNDDFEFPEYYIDDDLDKTERIQHMVTNQGVSISSQKKTIPITHKARQIVPKDSPIPLHNQIPALATNTCTSSLSALSKNLVHRPPVIPQNLAKPSENICQSAMSKSTELQDIRRKLLSRRSASDKDIASIRYAGINLIAKSHGSSRGREGVPVKPGCKQTIASDRLRSGASDPSISTSLMKEDRANNDQEEEASQQATTAADEFDLEEENTLMITCQDLCDELATNLSCCPNANKVITQKHETADGRDECTAGTSKKSETSQIQMKLEEVTKRQRLCDSDSVESDMWVKEKLGDIQRKIQRRKARPVYVLSSDEEDSTASTDRTPPLTSAVQVFPKARSSIDSLKAKKSRSLLDMGIQMDNNYSKVMKELKMKYKARRMRSDASSSVSSKWKQDGIKETFPQGCMSNRNCNIKQPTFTTSNKSASSVSYICDDRKSTYAFPRSQEKASKNRVYNDLPPVIQKKARSLPRSISSSEADGQDTKRESWRPGKSKDSGHSFRSMQKSQDQVDSPEWEENTCPKKGSRRPSILRKYSKETVGSHRSVPLPLPRSKPKISPSQMSKSTEKAISFEDLSEMREKGHCQGLPKSNCPQPTYEPFNTSKRTFFSSRRGSTTRTTENWLQEQNFDQGSMNSYQDHPQDPERYSILLGGRSSRHSVVSFSKCESIIEKMSISSKHSNGSKRSSPQHRHEGRSKASSSSGRSHQRGKSAGKDNHSASAEVEKPSVREVAGSSRQRSSSLCKSWSPQKEASSVKDDHYLTVGVEHPVDRDNEGKTSKAKSRHGNSALGLHRFYIPRESWPDGCRAKLNVKVNNDSQHVTTTATNPANGLTETLLDQIFMAPNLKSTIQME